MEKILREGEGWRVGWNPMAEKYPGLIGGKDWAIELTSAEWDDFRRLLAQLTAVMSELQAELMDEERLACEVESDLLWLEGEGFPHAYDLRILLYQGRRCEGNWTATAVLELIQAIENL